MNKGNSQKGGRELHSNINYTMHMNIEESTFLNKYTYSLPTGVKYLSLLVRNNMATWTLAPVISKSVFLPLLLLYRHIHGEYGLAKRKDEVEEGKTHRGERER